MASALDLTAELYAGSWTGISSYVYQRDTVTVQRGRQNEASTLQPCNATLTLNNRDGRFTTRNPAGAYYPNLVQNTPLRLSVPVADAGLPNYLRLETDTASYASCPDSAGLQITSGTLSVRWDGQVTDWTNNHVLVAKAGATANAWGLWTNGDGTLTFGHWDSGGTLRNAPHPGQLPYFNARIAIRVDYSISAQTVTWYWAPTMSGSWTQLGAVAPTTATTQAAGAGQPVQVGNGAALPGMYGSVYEVQIYSTATLEADPVFSSQTAGVTSFTDAQSNVWTLTGTAELSGRLYRFHGEMSSAPKAADASASDVYVQATAYGVTQRLQNANTPLSSPMYRAYLRLPSSLNLAAYWPCEDGTNSTSIGSAIGGPPMQILGSPNLASDSNFACSNPLPVMNGGAFIGTVPSWPAGSTDAAVRFNLDVSPSEANGCLVIGMTTSGGSFQGAAITYNTASGGELTMNVLNTSGVVVQTIGPLVLSGGPGLYRVAMDLKTNGTGTDATLATLQPGASEAVVFTTTIASSSPGQVTQVQAGSLALQVQTSAIGHISVQGIADSLFDLNGYQTPAGLFTGALNAWANEPAAVRVSRLCAEEGITCRIAGPADLSMPMGNQPIDTLINILQDCENTDLGRLFEPRQVLGIGYRTRGSMYHQTAAVTASYSSQQLFQGFASTGDTQLVVNDVTAQAPDGSLARQFLAAGAMSVQSPPSGIGRIATQIQPNPAADGELTQIASWYLSVRSVDDDRYPSIPFVMNRSANPAAVLVADIGDLLQVTGTPAWLPPPPVSQICEGFQETYFPGPYWQLVVNGSPELPYETAQVGVALLDTAGSTLTAGITNSATSFQVTTQAGSQPWNTSAPPFDIVIDRERMTVGSITSATSPQTFGSVTRSVNGVVVAHSTDADVSLYHPCTLSL